MENKDFSSKPEICIEIVSSFFYFFLILRRSNLLSNSTFSFGRKIKIITIINGAKLNIKPDTFTNTIHPHGFLFLYLHIKYTAKENTSITDKIINKSLLITDFTTSPQ